MVAWRRWVRGCWGCGEIGRVALCRCRGEGRCEPLAVCFRLRRAIFVHVCATVLSFAFSVSLALGYGGPFTFIHTHRHACSHTIHPRIRASLALASPGLSVVRGGESARARPRRSSLSRPLCVSPASRPRAAHSCGVAVSPYPCLFASLRRRALARRPLSLRWLCTLVCASSLFGAAAPRRRRRAGLACAFLAL